MEHTKYSKVCYRQKHNATIKLNVHGQFNVETEDLYQRVDLKIISVHMYRLIGLYYCSVFLIGTRFYKSVPL